VPRSSQHDVTELLRAWTEGDAAALEKLTPLVYEHLHRLAHSYMTQEAPGHTLQTTPLINEAYLRLIDAGRVSWQNRAHFFAMCAKVMRQILTDFARSRLSVRRGAEAQHLSLDESLTVSRQPRTDLVALDEALDRLAGVDPRKSQVVEMRFFGGLSVEETAEVLKVSPETVKRDWRLARSWLVRELIPSEPGC